MNQHFRLPVPAATKTLVVTNIVIFLLLSLLPLGFHDRIDWTFGLSRAGLEAGFYWQLVTHQFLHGDLIHLLVNMLGLWFAGREVERLLGLGKFLFVYILGGIMGGAFQMLFSAGDGPLIGASGSVCAVLLTFTTLVPNAPIMALIFFVVPVRTRAKYLGIGLVVVSIFFWLSGIEPNVGHLAHLGGFLTGFVFAKLQRRRFWGEWSHSVPPRHSARVVRPRFDVVDPAPPQVDAILEKILRYGISSLSAQEKQILEDARNRRHTPW